MKLGLGLGVLSLTISMQTALASAPDGIRYIHSITTDLPALEANAEAIWPGLSVMNKLPIIVADQDNNLYGLRYQPSQMKGWQPPIAMAIACITD